LGIFFSHLSFKIIPFLLKMECSVCYQQITEENNANLICHHPLCLHCPLCRENLDSEIVDLRPYLDYIGFRQEENQIESCGICLKIWFGMILFFEAGFVGNFIYQTWALQIFHLISSLTSNFFFKAFLLSNYTFWGLFVPILLTGLYIRSFQKRYICRTYQNYFNDKESIMGFSLDDH
jgi:hypothetical protein